jgi:hypothetical protein
VTLAWHIWLDWNNDGIYESDEAARLQQLRVERGQESLTGEPSVGNCEITLSNHDRRYDWWYDGSLCYPHSLIGKRVYITVELGGTTYDVFKGFIDKPNAQSIRAAGAGDGRARTMKLAIHDGWQLLKDRKVNIQLQTNITTKAAIQMILDAVGWENSASVWILGTSTLGVDTILGGISGADADLGSVDGDTLPYWWSEDAPADENLRDLIKAHFSRAWIGANGKFWFRTLAQENGAACDLTLGDSVLQEYQTYQRLEELYNRVSIKATPRELAAVADIWTLGEVVQLQPGESRTFYTDGSHAPATNRITPAATTDYTANTLADGTGTDLTTSLSAALTVNSSFSETITATNNHGSKSLYITLLKLRGQLIEDQDGVAQVVEDTDSIEMYGERALGSDLKWQQNSEVARDLATFACAFFKTPRNNLMLQFEHSATGLAYDLGTKILDGTTQGTGEEYRIGKITHECSGERMQNLITQWYGYPVYTDTFWQLGSATLSQLGSTTALGV